MSDVEESIYGAGDASVVNLAKGHPNPRLLPLDEVRKAFDAAQARDPSRAPTAFLQYGETQGPAELRRLMRPCSARRPAPRRPLRTTFW